MKQGRAQATAGLAFLLSVLAGCGGGDARDVIPGDTPPRQGAIRVVNVISDTSTVTGFLNGGVFANPSYGEASILAKTIVGRYLMSILAPTPAGTTETLVQQESIELSQEDEVSLLMLGSLANSTLVRIDNVEIDFGIDFSQPATFPQPDYQIVHGSESTGPVDVYVTEQSVDLATVSPSATVSFGNVTPLVKLDSAVTYRLRVTPIGSKTVSFDSGPYTQGPLSRSIYLLLDNFGPGGEALRVANVTAAGVLNFPQQTLVGTFRFANLIPDSGAVDVYLGATTGVPTFPNVVYGATTAYVQIPPATVTVNITPAGDPATVILHADITPIGGQARTFYVSGLESNSTVNAAFVLESLRPIATAGQFGIVVAAPSAARVDVYLTSAGQPISDVAALMSGAGLLANASVIRSAGEYDLTVTNAGTSIELLGPIRMTLDAGSVYDASIFDAPGGGNPLQFEVTQQVLP